MLFTRHCLSFYMRSPMKILAYNELLPAADLFAEIRECQSYQSLNEDDRYKVGRHIRSQFAEKVSAGEIPGYNAEGKPLPFGPDESPFHYGDALQPVRFRWSDLVTAFSDALTVVSASPRIMDNFVNVAARIASRALHTAPAP